MKRNLNIKNILTKNFLEQEYINNRKSTIKIAQENNTNYETVRKYLKKYNILIRTLSESMKGKKLSKEHYEKIKLTMFKKGFIPWNKGLLEYQKGHPAYVRMIGIKNPAWKGGITELNFKIRNSEKYLFWRKFIFKRDSYTCQICGQKSGKLVVDHIIPFTKILNSFLIKYRDINKYSLFLLALDYDDFWNLDNGRTLCNKCHKQTDTYGGRATNFVNSKEK